MKDIDYYVIDYGNGIKNTFYSTNPEEMMNTICHYIMVNRNSNRKISDIYYRGSHISRKGNQIFKFVFVDEDGDIIWKKIFTPNDSDEEWS